MRQHPDAKLNLNLLTVSLSLAYLQDVHSFVHLLYWATNFYHGICTGCIRATYKYTQISFRRHDAPSTSSFWFPVPQHALLNLVSSSACVCVRACVRARVRIVLKQSHYQRNVREGHS